MAYYTEKSIKKSFSSAIDNVLKAYKMNGVLSVSYHYEDDIAQTSVILTLKSGILDFGYCHPCTLQDYNYSTKMTVSKTAKEFLHKIFEILDRKTDDYYVMVKIGELNNPYRLEFA